MKLAKTPLLETLRRRLSLLLAAACLAWLVACSGGGGGGETDDPPAPAPEVYRVTTPVRIAERDAGTLAVSDADTQKIVFVDKQTLAATGGFKVAGKPSGVVFAAGRFYVGNVTNGSVEVFDAQGRRSGRVGARGQFGLVNDLAVDANAGRLYVLDARSRTVSLFDLDGTPVGTIGPAPLVRPTALAVDTSGRLIVSDFGDPLNGSFSARPVYLRVFNATGAYSHGILAGTNENTTPQGLGTHGGNVYMANARAGEVKSFVIGTGSALPSLGTLGVGPGGLFYPLDIFVDEPTGDVFVADHGNHRIAVFRGGAAP